MGNFTLQHKPKPFWNILLSYRLAFLIILAILAIIILLILVALRTRIQVKWLFKIYAIHVYNCLASPKRYRGSSISVEIGSSQNRAFIEIDKYRSDSKTRPIFCPQIAIELIEEGSKSVGQNFGSIFFPIVPFFLHVLVVAFFAGVAMYLSSW